MSARPEMGMGVGFVFVNLPLDVQPTRVRRGDLPGKAK